MKALSLVGLAVAFSATTLPLSHAGNDPGIHRCENSDGSVVYTDRFCGSFGSKAAPLSGAVLARIARDASPASMTGKLAGDAAKRSLLVARRSLQSGCARTPTQLSMDLQGSLALRNVNRLAESYHWVDQSHRQAQPLMQRLEELAGRPLLNARFYNAQIGPGTNHLAGTGLASGAMGVMQLSFAEPSGVRVIDFEVLGFSGCYFIRF